MRDAAREPEMLGRGEEPEKKGHTYPDVDSLRAASFSDEFQRKEGCSKGEGRTSKSKEEGIGSSIYTQLGLDSGTAASGGTRSNDENHPEEEVPK